MKAFSWNQGNNTKSNIISFDSCPLSNLTYSGVDPKIGIIYNNEPWILKYRRNLNGLKLHNHVSEYLGSNIFKLFNISAQECILGLYNGEQVVAVKDFIYNTGYTLREFDDVHESSLNSFKRTGYTYESVIENMNNYKHIVPVSNLIYRFWFMYIIDALIANFDRHGHNWGILKKDSEGKLAPIYDNGSSLFPRISDSQIEEVLHNKDELFKRIYKFPTPPILYNNQKSSYYNIITSGEFKDCSRALDDLINLSNSQNILEKIYNLINETIFISDLRKQFLKAIIHLRYTCIWCNYNFEEMYKNVFSI